MKRVTHPCVVWIPDMAARAARDTQTFKRWIAAGRVPAPDLVIAGKPCYSVELAEKIIPTSISIQAAA